MTSCASVSERIHSSSSNCFEVGSFFKHIFCVLSRKRHSSGKSPVAHLFVRMSRPRKRRLLWPAGAKETMASRCSCRSPVGAGSTHRRQFDVWQRSDTCFVLALLPHRAPCPCTFLHAKQSALPRRTPSSNARAPWDESCSPVSAAVCRALRGAADQFLMALLMEPRAVKAKARFPRCSSVCGCTLLAVLRSGQDFC